MADRYQKEVKVPALLSGKSLQCAFLFVNGDSLTSQKAGEIRAGFLIDPNRRELSPSLARSEAGRGDVQINQVAFHLPVVGQAQRAVACSDKLYGLYHTALADSA